MWWSFECVWRFCVLLLGCPFGRSLRESLVPRREGVQLIANETEPQFSVACVEWAIYLGGLGPLPLQTEPGDSFLIVECGAQANIGVSRISCVLIHAGS